jgi:hypothetical protein
MLLLFNIHLTIVANLHGLKEDCFCNYFFAKKCLKLMFSARGQATTYAAGPVASLAKQSLALNPQNFIAPVIVIESHNG